MSDQQFVSTERRARKRSVAWVYYSVITLILAVASIKTGAYGGLALAGATALYAGYIFRGGRWVLWIW